MIDIDKYLEDESFLESLNETIIEEINSDEEVPCKKMRGLLNAYAECPEVVDEVIMNLCGWSMNTLIDMSR